MASAAGRPRTFDTDETLDAALELFWKNGYRVTTTRDLEASLGLNASSIYNAFGSKEALLIAALERYEGRITCELVEPLERSASGLDAIATFFESLGHWITHDGRRGCMLVNLLAEDAGATPAISGRVREYQARVRTALRGALARSSPDGHGSTELDTRVELLMCQVFGLNIAARGGAGPKELERMVTAVQRQLAEWRSKGDSAWQRESNL